MHIYKEYEERKHQVPSFILLITEASPRYYWIYSVPWVLHIYLTILPLNQLKGTGIAMVEMSHLQCQVA